MGLAGKDAGGGLPTDLAVRLPRLAAGWYQMEARQVRAL